jgi:hypothetical protein
MLVAFAAALMAAQANGKSACADMEIMGPCHNEESQTDPAPYVIGAFGGDQFRAPDGTRGEKWRLVVADV